MIIPTCEEVFFMSRHKERLEKHCVVFCDDFQKLRLLHNKYAFLEAAKDCGVLIPETDLIDSRQALHGLTHTEQKVFKPVFSRFASHTLIRPEKTALQSITLSKEFPWVAQAYIPGTEYCTYSIAVNGRLQAHSCYQPKYRAGIGSGIYFIPALRVDIREFVDNFVKKHHYTGQIGFDFIITEQNELYVLECNPRATSGNHCLPDSREWEQIIVGNRQTPLTSESRHKMVSLAMMTFGLKYLRQVFWLTLLKDFYKAHDPVWNRHDRAPSFYQCISLMEIIIKAMKQRVSLKEAATADIEWNGEPL